MTATDAVSKLTDTGFLQEAGTVLLGYLGPGAFASVAAEADINVPFADWGLYGLLVMVVAEYMASGSSKRRLQVGAGAHVIDKLAEQAGLTAMAQEVF